MVRLKSRFLVLRLAFKDGRVGGEPSTEAALTAALKAALASAFGDAGAAAAASGAVSARWLDPVGGVAVVRCGRESVGQVSEWDRGGGGGEARAGLAKQNATTPLDAHPPPSLRPSAPRRRRPHHRPRPSLRCCAHGARVRHGGVGQASGARGGGGGGRRNTASGQSGGPAAGGGGG